MHLTFWHRLPIIATTAVGVLVVSSLLVYFLRLPIATRILEHYITKPDLKVSCIDFNLHFDLSLSIDKLCLDSPAFKLKVSRARWVFVTNELVIGELSIKHFEDLNEPTPDPNASKTIDLATFTLSPYLPRLNVKQLRIESPKLTQVIKLNVSQPSATSLVFNGDIQAKVWLEKQMVKLEAHWTLGNFLDKFAPGRALIAQQPILFSQTSFVNSSISSTVQFDGQRMTSQHQLNLSVTYHPTQYCQLTTLVKGDILAQFDLTTTAGTADLSQLHSQISLDPDCNQDTQLPELFWPTELIIGFPQKISLTANSLTVPHITLTDGKAAHVKLDFHHISYTLGHTSQQNGVQGEFALSLDLSASSPGAKNAPITSFNTAGRGRYSADHWQLDIPQSKLNLVDHNFMGVHFEKADIEFSAKLHKLEGLTLNGQGLLGKITSSGDQTPALSVSSLSSHFNVTAKDPTLINLNLHNSLQTVKHDRIAIKRLNNELAFIISNLNNIQINGSSEVNSMVIDGLDAGYLLLNTLTAQHDINAELSLQRIHSQHQVSIDERFAATVIQKQNRLEINVLSQKVVGLQNALHSILPDIKLTNGLLTGHLSLDLETLTGDGSIDLQQLSAQYQELVFKQLTTASSFSLDSAGLQLAGANLHLAGADVGLAITDIDAEYQIIDSQIHVQQVSGHLLGGSFGLSGLWLDRREQHIVMQIAHLDLAKIVELQQQTGIQLSGEIGGTLPMQISTAGVEITDGKIASHGPGKLRIVDYPAFESIKAQQEELAFLENLDFAQLTSNVRLKNDGWLFLDFAILGKNPKLGQAVNFNYSHEENILTLLRSLRLTDEVQDQIEQKINQGGVK